MERQNTVVGFPGFRLRDNSLRHPALALVLWPNRGLVRDISLVLLGSLFIALAAQVSIPLPFTPVPITGQTFAVLLTGALLGSKRSTIALLAYLGEGAAGLPVFAGGTAGWAPLVGPTGGYLIGFVGAAFIVGWLSEQGWDRRLVNAALTYLLGNIVIYVFGLPWLARFVGIDSVFALGLIPFIPGDLIKVALGALAVTGLWKFAKRFR